jgi:ACS family tartrate transporter-like MFS transporter
LGYYDRTRTSAKAGLAMKFRGGMKDLTGGYAGGLYGLALLGLIAAIVCAVFLHIPNRMPSSALGAPAE